MDKIVDFIIRFKKSIIITFFIILTVFGFAALKVEINYNMIDYLPEEVNSTDALNILDDNFSNGIANAFVMIPNVTLMEAAEEKEKLTAIEGVEDVLWMDDVLDLTTPIAMLDQDTVESYYKDGNALYTLTIQDGMEKEAVAGIYELIGEDGSLIGSAAMSAFSQSMALSTSVKAIVVLGVLILLILILTTKSWIEPLLYFFTIGTAIVINLGMSIFSGEMSFVTLSVTPILQLAVSLDYAVFLSHSFEANRDKTSDVNEAMKLAMKDSFKSIFGSAATTFFGFIALMFMDFKIGPDMGVSLVRGVVISYLCVMIFLPAVILCIYKLLDRTKHKSLLPDFHTAGKVLVKMRMPILILVLLLAFPVFLAQKNNEFLYGTGEAEPDSRIGLDEEKIEAVFDNLNTMVVLVPTGDSTSEMQLCEDLEALPYVKTVTSYVTMVSNKIPEEFLSEEIVSNFYSEDYARIIVGTTLDTEGQAAFDGMEEIRQTAAQYYGDEVYAVGETANMYDMMVTVQRDNQVVNMITLVTIFLVLLLQFKSLILPVILIFTIKVAIWINMSVPYFTGEQMSYIGYLVVSAVMMGATIDYAILLTDRYMKERQQKPPLKAMRDTITDCIKSMLVSALTMTFAGFSLGMISNEEIIQVLGILIGRGGAVAFILTLTLLPSVLLVFDRWIPYLSLGAKFYNLGRKTPMSLD
ncbi:MAG: efflux RND transporter permease subunit [Lachnospiraceae bacterium]